MKPLILFALTTVLAACAPSTTATSSSSAPTAGPAGDRAGTIVKINDSIWAITPADQSTMRYCFEGALATPALRVDGKKIHFAGTVGEIPPNARLACTPFKLTTVTAD